MKVSLKHLDDKENVEFGSDSIKFCKNKNKNKYFKAKYNLISGKCALSKS
jgi:hypothetical protein